MVVCGGDDCPDPQGAGRVKILTALMHPDTPIDKLPWSQVASQAGNFGGMSFNGPPPVGSIVDVRFPGGTKGYGAGLVGSILHGVHDPAAKKAGTEGGTGSGTNVSTGTQGWAKAAREWRPTKASGPARVEQVVEKNDTGADKLTTKVTYEKPPSMADREGTNSSGINKGMLSTLKGIKGIYTGAMAGYFKNEPGTGNSGMPSTTLPGVDGSIMDNIQSIVGSIQNDLLKAGAQNIGSLLSVAQKTNNAVTNMSNQGNKTDLGSWLSAAQSELSKAKTHLELQDALFKIQTQSFLEEGLKKLPPIVQQIASPYTGKQVTKKIMPDGTISIENLSEIAGEAKKMVESRMGQLLSAATKGGIQLGSDELGPKFTSSGGGMHSGLSIAGDLLLAMGNIDKKNGIQKSLQDKFVYNPDFHEAGLQFAWFMSSAGTSGSGNTIPDDQRDPKYKSGSSMT